MVRATKVTSGIDGLLIDFSVERLSLVVLLVMSWKRWRWHINGHLLMSRIINIERWWLSVDGPSLVGTDLGVKLSVVTVLGLMTWIYGRTETVLM